MAVFETEDRILRRTEALKNRRPEPQFVDTGPAMNFVVGAGTGGTLGAARRRDQGIAAARRNANFGNVRSGVQSTEELVDPQARAARRSAPQVSAEGGAGFSAPSLGSMGGASERERQAARSEIDSALFDLRARGGGVNMASKRRLLGDLLGQKGGLTTEAFRAQNERDMQNQRVNAQTAEGNARLRESAAERRDRINSFNVETGEKRSMYETDRDDAAAAAAAAAPMNALKMQDLRQRIGANDARATRDQATFDAQFPGAASKPDLDAIDTYMKANPGMSYDAAAAKVLDDAIVNGENPRRSRVTSAAYDDELSGLESQLNQSGAMQWGRQVLGGDGYIPFNRRQAPALTDSTQVEVEQLSPINPIRMFTGDNFRIKARDANGEEIVNYIDDESAKRLQRRNRLLQNGGR